jgi:hypothetical protein
VAQKEPYRQRMPLTSIVRIIGRTAFFCYLSVITLLVVFNGPRVLDELKESGCLLALGALILGSGMLGLVAPRNRKE